MDEVIKRFKKAFHDQYNRAPVWLPGSNLVLGDIVALDDEDELTRHSTLADKHIAFDTDSGLRKIDYTFSTGEGVSMNAGLSGTANEAIPGVAIGNLAIKFSYSSSSSLRV